MEISLCFHPKNYYTFNCGFSFELADIRNRKSTKCSCFKEMTVQQRRKITSIGKEQTEYILNSKLQHGIQYLYEYVWFGLLSPEMEDDNLATPHDDILLLSFG